MTIKDKLNEIIADKLKEFEMSLDSVINEYGKSADELSQEFEILGSQLKELFDSIDKKYAEISITDFYAEIEIGYFNEEKGDRETDIYLKIIKSYESVEDELSGMDTGQVKILPGFDIEKDFDDENLMHFDDDQSVIKYMLEKLGKKIAEYQFCCEKK